MTRLSPVTNIGQVKLPLLVPKSMHLWITGMIQQYQAFKKVPFSHPGRDFFQLGMQLFIFTCPLSKSRASSPATKSIKQQLRIAQDKQNLRTVCSKGELRFFFWSPEYPCIC